MSAGGEKVGAGDTAHRWGHKARALFLARRPDFSTTMPCETQWGPMRCEE